MLTIGAFVGWQTVAPTILIYNWTGTNFKRYTGKVTACAMIQVGFGIANIIGPQTFQARDAPGYVQISRLPSLHIAIPPVFRNSSGSYVVCEMHSYLPAKITIVVTNAVAIGICTGLRVLYGLRNARADRDGMSAQGWVERKMEKADPGGFDEDGEGRFRYVY